METLLLEGSSGASGLYFLRRIDACVRAWGLGTVTQFRARFERREEVIVDSPSRLLWCIWILDLRFFRDLQRQEGKKIEA